MEKRWLRISETGNQSGFTLLEMVVTLFILSAVVGVVVAMIPSEQRYLDQAVNRSLGLLKSCRSNAIISGRSHSILVQDNNVTFSVFVNGDWYPEKNFDFADDLLFEHKVTGADLKDNKLMVECSSDGLVTEFNLCISIQKNRRCLMSVGNGTFEISD